jgi:DNA sulfur modification protein DndC
LYQKADKEIAFTFDKSTPAGGDSRFGCWVCTVVRRDRSVEGLIEDGETWLEPLLEFRNWLKKIRDDPTFREGVRKNDRKRKIRAEKMGEDFALPEHRGHKILGPFTFEARHEMLRRLLQLQEKVSDKKISLISPEEIKAIETIWIYEGDTVSTITDVLKSASSEGFVNATMLPDQFANGSEFLSKICEKNGVSLDLVGQLMAVEKDLSSLSRRIGIYNRLEKVIDEHFMREYRN